MEYNEISKDFKPNMLMSLRLKASIVQKSILEHLLNIFLQLKYACRANIGRLPISIQHNKILNKR